MATMLFEIAKAGMELTGKQAKVYEHGEGNFAVMVLLNDLRPDAGDDLLAEFHADNLETAEEEAATYLRIYHPFVNRYVVTAALTHTSHMRLDTPTYNVTFVQFDGEEPFQELPVKYVQA